MSRERANVEEQVEQCIYLIRGAKVMLDEDLAHLYEVETRALVQAVKRNKKRFPPDFMFQLTTQEYDGLRSQIVISTGRTGRRHLPLAFTEQGIAMLSGVLRSDKAIEVNIEIMRAFVRLRRILAEHEDLKFQLQNLEKRYDHQFKVVFEAIRELTSVRRSPKKHRIGFGRRDEET